jgi:deazaflavin-dependent oxidoreductase (nitroreductase family)
VEVVIMTATEIKHDITLPTPPKVPSWVNATMRSLLRSPLSRLVDRGIVLLTVTGRRTGRRFSFPVQYVQDGDTLWITSGAGPEKTWWRNLVGGAPIEVFLRRHPFEGTAEVATHEDDPATVEEGVRRYAERFPRFARRLGIDSDPEVMEAYARSTVIVRIYLDR